MSENTMKNRLAGRVAQLEEWANTVFAIAAREQDLAAAAAREVEAQLTDAESGELPGRAMSTLHDECRRVLSDAARGEILENTAILAASRRRHKELLAQDRELSKLYTELTPNVARTIDSTARVISVVPKGHAEDD